MLEPEQVRDVLRRGLAASKADLTEVLFIEHSTALTRYSNSVIHQNVAEDDLTVSVRVINEGRTGSARTNKIDPASLEETVRKATVFADASPADPNFRDLPSPREEYPERQGRYESTALFGPDDRAAYVREVIDRARREGMAAAGTISASALTVGVANSNGVEAIDDMTEAQMGAVVTGPDSTGFAEGLAPDVRSIDAKAIGEVATAKAKDSAGPRDVEPGRWTVILEPSAVADMLGFLAYVGFGAKAYQEKRSFMTGKIGQRIMGENVTIYDDGLDARAMSLGFDFEGVPKQKVMLVEGGVARGVVYDSYTAALDSTCSTGHALPAPNTHGPLATNIFMVEGADTVENLIASTERGILVTRFHYTNIEHPIKTTLTGLTRDGTFLIEAGKIAGGVRNLRFTQSVIEALNNVTGITSERRLSETMLGAYYVPTLRIDGFNFTGATEY